MNSTAAFGLKTFRWIKGFEHHSFFDAVSVCATQVDDMTLLLSAEAVNNALEPSGRNGTRMQGSIAVESVPREALFLAGKVFLSYRRGRGTKHSVLPDFYIGAHAAVMQWPILTRDAGRYTTYFPSVPLITP